MNSNKRSLKKQEKTNERRIPETNEWSKEIEEKFLKSQYFSNTFYVYMLCIFSPLFWRWCKQVVRQHRRRETSWHCRYYPVVCGGRSNTIRIRIRSQITKKLKLLSFIRDKLDKEEFFFRKPKHKSTIQSRNHRHYYHHRCRWRWSYCYCCRFKRMPYVN